MREFIHDLAKTDDTEIKLALYMQDFMAAFYQERGLQYLIDTAGSIFGRPMVLHDTSFRILACTYDAEDVVEFIEDENKDLYINEDTIQYIRSHAIMEKMRKDGSANYVEKENPLHGTLLSIIKVNEIEVGQLAIYEAGLEFQPLDYKLADQFRLLLSLEIQRSNWLGPHKRLMPNYVLEDLLEGRSIGEEAIKSRLHYLPWIQDGPFHMMVISNKSFEILDSKIPFALQALKRLIPIKNCMAYRSELVVFIDNCLFHKLFDSGREAFAQFLENNGLSAGVSLEFSELERAKKYHFLAQRALDIGRRRGWALSFFDQCGFYIISEMITSQYDIEDFCHPSVLWLKEYDRLNQTELMRTLKYYIHYTSSPNTAAKLLNIHRNTLFYRINRIKELTGLLLENADEIYLVYLSIKLLEVNLEIDLSI